MDVPGTNLASMYNVKLKLMLLYTAVEFGGVSHMHSAVIVSIYIPAGQQRVAQTSHGRMRRGGGGKTLHMRFHLDGASLTHLGTFVGDQCIIVTRHSVATSFEHAYGYSSLQTNGWTCKTSSSLVLLVHRRRSRVRSRCGLHLRVLFIVGSKMSPEFPSNCQLMC